MVIKNKGYTLIEMVIVIGILGVIMAAVTGIILTTFKANNRVKILNKVIQNGDATLEELRKNIVNSRGSNITCPAGIGQSLSYTSIVDAQTTILNCVAQSVGTTGRISSESGGRVVNLVGSDVVKVMDCTNFISCSTIPSSSDIANINFNFKLGAGVSGAGGQNFENYVEQLFESKVVVRN